MPNTRPLIEPAYRLCKRYRFLWPFFWLYFFPAMFLEPLVLLPSMLARTIEDEFNEDSWRKSTKGIPPPPPPPPARPLPPDYVSKR